MADQQERRPLGGTGPPREATEQTQALADKVRPELEEKTNRTFSEYKAVQYRQQLVAGMNYFIKVATGDSKCVHLRVYEDLQQQVSLTSYKLDVALDAPIEYF